MSAADGYKGSGKPTVVSTGPKLSPQAQAKFDQGYSTTPSNCGNCTHRTSTLAQPSWTANPAYVQEKNLRCGIGKFAIRQTATCNRHEVRS